jgi:protein O-mannosyl-transferase
MSKVNSKPTKNNQPQVKKKVAIPKAVYPIKFAWGIVIAAIAFILFANTISHDYALDDSGAITENRYVQEGFHGIPKLLKVDFWHFSNVHLGYYRPLSLITFAIEYHFVQKNPHVSHFINILIFALSGFFLFIVLNKLFNSYNPLFPFIVALLYIAHPIHTEIVANIKGRDEILSFFNTMAMMWFALKYIDTKKMLFLVLGLVSCYLAMLSKETALTGVLLLPVIIFYYTDMNVGESLKKAIPFALVALLFFIQKKQLLGTLSGIIPDDIVNYPYVKSNIKLPTTFMLFAFCLRLLIVPHPLRYDYSFNQMPAVTIGNGWALLGVLIFFTGAYYAYKLALKKNIFGLALSIFYITLIPSLAFTIMRGGIFAERFLFFPALGFCIALVYGVALLTKTNISVTADNTISWLKTNTKFIAPFVIVFVLYSFKTVDRNKAWKDNFTLFSTDIKSGKNSAQNQRHLGNQYIYLASNEKDSLKKIEYATEGIDALKQSLRIYPKFGESYYQIGLAYQIITPNKDSSIYYYNKAIQTAPGYAYSYYNLGIVYQTMGKNNVASFYYNEAIKYNPEYLEPKQAAENLKAVGIDVHINPLTSMIDTSRTDKNSGYYYDLGNYYASQSDYTQAANSFAKAIDLDRRNEGAYINLSNCYGMLKQYDKSLAVSNQLLSINPKNTTALKNIAVMYNLMGNTEKSNEYLQKMNEVMGN